MTVHNNLKDIENWLSAEFSELGIDVTGPKSDFFHGGGSSLTAIKLISKVDNVYGEYVLPPVDLFERSELGQIAQTIQANATTAKETA